MTLLLCHCCCGTVVVALLLCHCCAAFVVILLLWHCCCDTVVANELYDKRGSEKHENAAANFGKTKSDKKKLLEDEF